MELLVGESPRPGNKSPAVMESPWAGWTRSWAQVSHLGVNREAGTTLLKVPLMGPVGFMTLSLASMYLWVHTVP